MQTFLRVASYLLILICLLGLGDAKKKLYYGGLFQISNTSAWNTRGVVPATEMALEHINNSTDILKDYELVQTVKDDECTAELAVKEFIKFLTSSEKYIALLGPGCSVGSQALSELASAWNIIQLSFGATSALLSDDKKYPLFWRTVTPETTHNPARVAILKHYGWKKVAILRNNLDFTAMTLILRRSKDGIVYLLTFRTLVLRWSKDIYSDEGPTSKMSLSRAVSEVIKDSNIEILTEAVYHDSPQDTIQLLQQKDARIIMAFMYEENYRKTLCEAYKRGYYGAKYVWINYGFLAPKWWLVEDTECSVEQIKMAMGNCFSVNLLTISTDPQPTISGYSAPELWTEYIRRLSLSDWYKDWFHDHSGFAYDGVWTLALMLNTSISLLAKKGLTLEDFDHKDVTSLFPSLFEEVLKNLYFIGMSGPVSFDHHGDRQTISVIKQLQDDEDLEIADYDEKTDSLVFNRGRQFIWASGPPIDGVIEEEIMEVIQLKLVAVMTSLSLGGIILALWFLVFNLRKRHLRYIKMSSPRLNVLIIIGCILVYLCGILMGLDGGMVLKDIIKTESLCQAEIWTFCTGFTFAFGAMFFKTWRVYTIFSNKKEIKRRVIKDFQLILAVIGLLFLDIVIITIWQIIDPVSLQRTDLPAEVDPANSDLKYQPFFQTCWSEHLSSFENVLLAYKGLLLVYGAVLAFETRNVTVPALNDSKNIGTAIYIVIISCMMVMPLKSLLAEKLTVKFGLIVGLEFSATTAILCSVFLPKVLHLRRDPTGESETNTDFGTQNQQSVLKAGSNHLPLSVVNKSHTPTSSSPPQRRATNRHKKNSVHVAAYVNEQTTVDVRNNSSSLTDENQGRHSTPFTSAPSTSAQNRNPTRRHKISVHVSAYVINEATINDESTPTSHDDDDDAGQLFQAHSNSSLNKNGEQIKSILVLENLNDEEIISDLKSEEFVKSQQTSAFSDSASPESLKRMTSSTQAGESSLTSDDDGHSAQAPSSQSCKETHLKMATSDDNTMDFKAEEMAISRPGSGLSQQTNKNSYPMESGAKNIMNKNLVRKNNFMIAPESSEDDFAPLEDGFSNLFPSLLAQNQNTAPPKNRIFSSPVLEDVSHVENDTGVKDLT